MRKLKISVKNLSKDFENKKVLKKLNLNVFESESLAIIGESGSGKSVLTRCIIGLTKFNKGQIQYDNISDIKKLNEKNKLNHILL